MSNTQNKLSKVRTPRVHISYDVETGGSSTERELPLVIGVMGNFCSTDTPIHERTFTNIDNDNFNDIMKGMSPAADFSVKSALPGQEGELRVSLTFQSIDDFAPENVAKQVEPLRKLLAMREQLVDLRNRTASNSRLKEELLGLLTSGDTDSAKSHQEDADNECP